jgi:flagellar biosynthesis activator protein FlaF
MRNARFGPIKRINNRILTANLYKPLRQARNLIACKTEHLAMSYASNAYAKVAKETAAPRELEASLLLKAAAKLQAAHDSWRDTPSNLNDALLYNRRIWTVFVDALIRDDNRLPAQIRENLIKLGAFVLGETFALTTKPAPKHLKSIIKINRGIAAGLSGKA